MAGYSVRSLDELGAAARKYFTQSVPGTVASVWVNTFTVFGKVLALAGFHLELRRAWLVRQLFASTADEIWLTRHGFELGLTRAPASTAIGTITLPATPALVVPAGLQFARPDGATVTSLSAETASGPNVTLTVQADVAGETSNTDPGTILALVDIDDAPAGLGTSATVDAAGLGGGADLEPLERFRARVLARKRQPPQGGASNDYVTWAREALATVDRVFVDSFQNDARSVWVCFTVTDQPNGIPTPAQVAVVQAYIDDPIRRPVTARAFAVAPTAYPVAIQIGGLSPDTPDVRLAIQTELDAVFLDRGAPGTPSGPFVLYASWLEEAIARATGEDRHVLISPGGTLTIATSNLPVCGAVSFTDATVPVLSADAVAQALAYLPTTLPSEPNRPWNNGGELAFS